MEIIAKEHDHSANFVVEMLDGERATRQEVAALSEMHAAVMVARRLVRPGCIPDKPQIRITGISDGQVCYFHPLD